MKKLFALSMFFPLFAVSAHGSTGRFVCAESPDYTAQSVQRVLNSLKCNVDKPVNVSPVPQSAANFIVICCVRE